MPAANLSADRPGACPFARDLVDAEGLRVHAQEVVAGEFCGRRMVRVTNGLAVVSEVAETDFSVEVDLAVEGDAAYPGIAFRGKDASHYELVYVQPHTTGMWDAVQYDPVFNGSNTWQLYHGPAWQAAAHIPQKQWFTLRVDAIGGSAGVSIIDKDGRAERVLTVDRLRYGCASGFVGVWTFLPACFAQIRIGKADPGRISTGVAAMANEADVVTQWEVEGAGVVRAEENGVVNLNRVRAVTAEPAILCRQFVVERDGELAMRFGFSDCLELLVDGQRVFSGENRFAGGGRETRGYVALESHQVSVPVATGRHTLTARLLANEPFGWGMTLAARGSGLRWL